MEPVRCAPCKSCSLYACGRALQRVEATRSMEPVRCAPCKSFCKLWHARASCEARSAVFRRLLRDQLSFGLLLPDDAQLICRAQPLGHPTVIDEQAVAHDQGALTEARHIQVVRHHHDGHAGVIETLE